jgi:transposase-like protein
MEQKIIYRYSTAFKRQVIEDIESGRFSSIEQAREHYGIRGTWTIQYWLKRFGRNELLNKVVRVEKPNEQDEIRKLKQQIRHLKEVLGDKEALYALEEEYLKIACEELGTDVESFKKKEVAGSREYSLRRRIDG